MRADNSSLGGMQAAFKHMSIVTIARRGPGCPALAFPALGRPDLLNPMEANLLCDLPVNPSFTLLSDITGL
ncbi:hypothetical protein GCM10010833_15820 [Blastomonas aquatica]|uniref:Uncharacterized protein n=1 Tax=Blastomonas aquatica TaxID=1510276 RepID=A0ABQ1J7D9_9SPHN|nr:hypothetical protein GCM10010833_15820 [Blastomonas aquatica]